MTIQNLKYILAVAETGSITEAARQLHMTQPSLSAAVREVENEIGFQVFHRSHAGISLTKEGVEFIGYARQIVHEMERMEDRFISDRPRRQRFCVSTQHYTFAANAFVEMVQKFGEERYEFILNETQTHQILEDVKNRFCDLGILYLSDANERVLRKKFSEYGLSFHELISAEPHVFLQSEHPLAGRGRVTLEDLKPYPRLNFLQGNYESEAYSEELFSAEDSEKIIRVSDRAAIDDLMAGLYGYTISSGIFPGYLHRKDIIAIPLDARGKMRIGYVKQKGSALSELAEIYVEELKKYGKGGS